VRLIDIDGQAASFSVIEMVIGLTVLVVLIWLVFKLTSLLIATFKFLNGMNSDFTLLSTVSARLRSAVRGNDGTGVRRRASGWQKRTALKNSSKHKIDELADRASGLINKGPQELQA
jgi:hypothetical protein